MAGGNSVHRRLRGNQWSRMVWETAGGERGLPAYVADPVAYAATQKRRMRSEDWKGVLTGIFIIIALTLLAMLFLNQAGCISARPACYEADLIACNQTSKTLAESIACENKVRTLYGRPLRDAGSDQ